MPDSDDTQLLLAFCRDGSQEAFAVLARRYAGLLYHAALRQAGRPELAEEATQNALAILARKARTLSRLSSLASWLHRTVSFEAARLRRRERRYEQRMKQLQDDSLTGRDDAAGIPGEWNLHVDQALQQLPEADRELMMLRFFEGRTFEEIAQQCGGQAAAWRQRGTRALERLRRQLHRRGVVVPVTALAAALTASLTQTAPAGFVATLAKSSLTTAARSLPWSSLITHALHTMNAKQTGIAAAIVITLLTPLGFQAAAIHHSKQDLAALEARATALRASGLRDWSNEPGAAGSLLSRAARARTADTQKQSGGDKIDLHELARLAAEGRNADPLRLLKLRAILASLNPAEIAGLLSDAQKLDFPPNHRRMLYERLLSALAEEDPVLATTTGMQLVASLTGNDATLLWMNPLPNCLREWAEKDPAAARAWFQAQQEADAFQNTALGDADLTSWMAGGLFTGLMWGGNREEGLAFLSTLDDAGKAMSLRRFGTSNNSAADHAEILRLAAGIADSKARAEAVTGAVFTMARTDLARAGEYIGEAALPPAEERKLAVAAAVEPFRQDIRSVDTAERLAWLRGIVAPDQQEKATGYFLGDAAFADQTAVRAMVDRELAAGASDAFLGAFVRNAAHRTSTMDLAAAYLVRIDDPAERMRTLQEIQQGHRDAARTAALNAGVSLTELDAAAASR